MGIDLSSEENKETQDKWEKRWGHKTEEMQGVFLGFALNQILQQEGRSMLKKDGCFVSYRSTEVDDRHGEKVVPALSGQGEETGLALPSHGWDSGLSLTSFLQFVSWRSLIAHTKRQLTIHHHDLVKWKHSDTSQTPIVRDPRGPFSCDGICRR